MIDIKELRRLAQAAIAKMNASDPEFASSTPPLAILELLDRLEAAEKERDALRTKIEQMEKQKPVVEVQWAAGIPNGILDFISTDDYLPKLGDKLYARPGAKGEEK